MNAHRIAPTALFWLLLVTLIVAIANTVTLVRMLP